MKWPMTEWKFSPGKSSLLGLAKIKQSWQELSTNPVHHPDKRTPGWLRLSPHSASDCCKSHRLTSNFPHLMCREHQWQTPFLGPHFQTLFNLDTLWTYSVNFFENLGLKVNLNKAFHIIFCFTLFLRVHWILSVFVLLNSLGRVPQLCLHSTAQKEHQEHTSLLYIFYLFFLYRRI